MIKNTRRTIKKERTALLMEKYLTKKGICQMFSVPIDTLNKDLKKMRYNPEFENYVLKPSYKRVLIDPMGYEAFLKFKSSERIFNI